MRHHEELRQKEEKAKRDEHAKIRRVASSIAKEVRTFWSSVEKVKLIHTVVAECSLVAVVGSGASGDESFFSQRWCSINSSQDWKKRGKKHWTFN